MTSRRAIDSFTEIATLRMELNGSDPLIWRVVEVPTSVTLKVLHEVVQTAMGWFDYHLWEFRIGGRTYGLPIDEDFGTAPRRMATLTRLRDVVGAGATRIDYTYDFGDSWEHSLTVSDIRAGEAGVAYPRLVAGANNCPPEDCGGIPGLHAMLEALANPEHPDHEHVAEWLDDYDPQEFDVLLTEIALARIAARRNSAAKRILKAAKN